jgi:hypothetical protein
MMPRTTTNGLRDIVTLHGSLFSGIVAELILTGFSGRSLRSVGVLPMALTTYMPSMDEKEGT